MVLVALAVGCAAAGDVEALDVVVSEESSLGSDAAPVELADAPLPYMPRCDDVVLSPVPELRPIALMAAERWSAATGCNVRVGEGGVPIVFDSPILRPDGSQAPGATTTDRRRVRIDPRHAHKGRVVTHEIGHVLGGLDLPGDGIMGTGQPIDAAALASVCTVLDCRLITPEAP